MKIIRVRANGSRHGKVVAVCVRDDNGFLTSSTGISLGRAGSAKKGTTSLGRHYFTDQATDDEQAAFAALGLAEPPTPPLNTRRARGSKGRCNEPHRTPPQLKPHLN